MTSLDTVLNIASLAGEGTRLRADRVSYPSMINACPW
jgi:hypothetical protein